jgi:putative CocE/NonD family hydrolase
MSALEQAGRGNPPEFKRMPQPHLRLRLAMRDGIRLDTWVWLPERPQERIPAILMRTPYREEVLGWARSYDPLRFCDAGYALVYQLIRGTGASEGEFIRNSRQEANDGYDTIEWIATQSWCDGAVGMNGSSYLAMTQLWAASGRPPHLRCIIPSSPTLGPFSRRGRVAADCGAPYRGGAFQRMWAINWLNLISVDSLRELRGGFIATMPILSHPDWLRRMTSRPLIDAADDVLRTDRLRQYREAASHPTFDDWWRARSLQEEDWAKIEVPAFIMSGNFDAAVSDVLIEWRALEENAPQRVERHLLIGPWDHGLVPADRYGPHDLGPNAVRDLFALRLAFFDKHLKGTKMGLDLAKRVTLFITGSNEWHSLDRFPPTEISVVPLYLHSGGAANSARGDGRLSWEAPAHAEPSDSFVSDPTLPFVPALASADAALMFDLRESERCHERLVYSMEALEQPLTLLGEPEVVLHLAADAPDCDVVVWLAEHRCDGKTIELASGMLRLRYREGFDQEVLLAPGVPVKVRIPMSYVAHRMNPASILRLMVGADHFPHIDPNPNTGEPIATAIEMRVSVETIFHDVERPSAVLLPRLPNG